MMKIQVVCTACGEQSNLRPGEIALTGPPPSAQPRHGSYAFRCSWCGTHVERPADERAIGLLEAGGVRRDPAGSPPAPASSGHPENPPDGAPFTLDDLIDLHAMLADPGWFDRLTSLVELG